MHKNNTYTEIEKMRIYSSLFSRTVFSNILQYDDFSYINQVVRTYDLEKTERKLSYADYFKYLYAELLEKYRCEYVYKNMVINLLSSRFRSRDSLIVNEFRVGDCVADLALFNGISRVFEIKTEFDTPRRLDIQLSTYRCFFQEVYIVIPKSLLQDYIQLVDHSVGIIVLCEGRKPKLCEFRKPVRSDEICVDKVMRTLKISEYESIVKAYFDGLPNVGYYEMFDACKERLSSIPSTDLKKIINNTIKKRKSNTRFLHMYFEPLRQMSLALKLTPRQYDDLYLKLRQPIQV